MTSSRIKSIASKMEHPVENALASAMVEELFDSPRANPVWEAMGECIQSLIVGKLETEGIPDALWKYIAHGLAAHLSSKMLEAEQLPDVLWRHVALCLMGNESSQLLVWEQLAGKLAPYLAKHTQDGNSPCLGCGLFLLNYKYILYVYMPDLLILRSSKRLLYTQ